MLDFLYVQYAYGLYTGFFSGRFWRGSLVFGGLKKRKGVRDFFTLFFGMIFL